MALYFPPHNCSGSSGTYTHTARKRQGWDAPLCAAQVGSRCLYQARPGRCGAYLRCTSGPGPLSGRRSRAPSAGPAPHRARLDPPQSPLLHHLNSAAPLPPRKWLRETLSTPGRLWVRGPAHSAMELARPAAGPSGQLSLFT